MDYNGSAKNVRARMPANVTSGLGKLGEKISAMTNAIGSSMVETTYPQSHIVNIV
jgi:hypothetical protein